MKILHYTLGLPPYRTGGLTKYATDLMKTQVLQNNDVFLLFPGYYSIKRNTKIKRYTQYFGINVFEIVNPLPVPLLEGISLPKLFMEKAVPSDVYKQFLKSVNPDIIHVHTLMGIHKEFFVTAKELGIKIVFTTHDYFGLSTKPNMIDSEGKICAFEDVNKCIECNKNAYSISLIKIMQSRTYRYLKDSEIVKVLKNYKKPKDNESQQIQKDKITYSDTEQRNIVQQYKELKNYYYNIFNHVDYFHYNSSIAKEVYDNFLNTKGEIIAITHNDINDNRKIKTFIHSRALKITFLGPLDYYKGFPLLLESLKKLLARNQTNWLLNIYGNSNEARLNNNEKKRILFHGRYHQGELSAIFENTDILVVPSQWRETFGFIGLEAFSHGVPVLVSENVGFKDLIRHNETGLIFKPNLFALSNIIEELIVNRNKLEKININICKEQFTFSMERHAKKIQTFYERVLGE